MSKEQKSLIMRITKARIMSRLASTGRAHVVEDMEGFHDGKDEERLLEYMKTQVGTVEKLTLIESESRAYGDAMVNTNVTEYDVDNDDIEIVVDLESALT